MLNTLDVQKAYISITKRLSVDAERIAKLLGAEKAIVAGIETSLFKIPKEMADEILKLVELITPKPSRGYAVINGETLVFQRGEETIIAFVDADKIIGSIKRLSGNV
jgi:predicted hydrocarbon binding protein